MSCFLKLAAIGTSMLAAGKTAASDRRECSLERSAQFAAKIFSICAWILSSLL